MKRIFFSFVCVTSEVERYGILMYRSSTVRGQVLLLCMFCSSTTVGLKIKGPKFCHYVI